MHTWAITAHCLCGHKYDALLHKLKCPECHGTLVPKPDPTAQQEIEWLEKHIAQA